MPTHDEAITLGNKLSLDWIADLDLLREVWKYFLVTRQVPVAAAVA